MRSMAAVVVASFFATGLACAQMKVPQAQPQNATPAPTPVATATPTAPPTLESARRIKQDEAIDLVNKKKAVFVDVRPKDQYDLGHIKGAINIPLSDLMTHLDELPPGKFIITYCA